MSSWYIKWLFTIRSNGNTTISKERYLPTHKSVTCKITSVHKYLLWMSSCVSTYSKWMSRQICIQIKLQERWEAIVAGFALLAGAESQLEVYYDFPTLSPSATPCFWLKCDNSSWLITCIFWECRRTTQVRHVAEVTELSNTFSDPEITLKSLCTLAKLLTLQLLFNMQ